MQDHKEIYNLQIKLLRTHLRADSALCPNRILRCRQVAAASLLDLKSEITYIHYNTFDITILVECNYIIFISFTFQANPFCPEPPVSRIDYIPKKFSWNVYSWKLCSLLNFWEREGGGREILVINKYFLFYTMNFEIFPEIKIAFYNAKLNPIPTIFL